MRALRNFLIFLALLNTGAGCGLLTADQPLPSTARQARFHVEAMHCADCLPSLEAAIRAQPGIYKIDIDMRQETLRVFYDPKRLPNPQVLAASITRVGYPARYIAPQ